MNDLCQISSKKTNQLHHVETKRGDVRRKSARQQQQNENVETGNDRAEERDGCAFFISLLFFPLLFLLVRELKGNRSFDFGFLPSVRTMLCRVTDVVFFLSLFQTLFVRGKRMEKLDRILYPIDQLFSLSFSFGKSFPRITHAGNTLFSLLILNAISSGHDFTVWFARRHGGDAV